MQNNVQNYTRTEKRKIKPWTMEEIHKVQLLFENKRRIKEIARVVDRSESAVSKFLSRSGIRKAITLSIIFAIKAGALPFAGFDEAQNNTIQTNSAGIQFTLGADLVEQCRTNC